MIYNDITTNKCIWYKRLTSSWPFTDQYEVDTKPGEFLFHNYTLESITALLNKHSIIPANNLHRDLKDCIWSNILIAFDIRTFYWTDSLNDIVIPFVIAVYHFIACNRNYQTEKVVTELIFKSGFFREIMLGPLNMF